MWALFVIAEGLCRENGSCQDMHSANWHHIENMILHLPISELGSTNKRHTPKILFTYIKSMKNDNSGVAQLH